MKITDRIGDVTEKMQARRLEMKSETLDRENERLRAEMRAVREELEQERETRTELLDTLRSMPKGKVKVKKRGGMLRMLVVGGGAYVLGTRAGRERYEQIRSWASDMRGKMSGGDAETTWRPETSATTTPGSATTGTATAS
ncbi:MAG TPA: hypothetical protein VF044_02100 [Actinomycetota bacterium]